MAVQDIRSNLIVQSIGSFTDQGNGTFTFPGNIDSAQYELGLMFAFDITGVDASADVTINFQDKEEIADSYVNISFENLNFEDKIIGTTTLVVDTTTGEASETVENRLQTVGLISTKRFIQVQLVVTGAAGATMDGTCYVVQKAENKPTVESDA